MKSRRFLLAAVVLSFASCLALTGCSRSPAGSSGSAESFTPVTVSYPVEQTIIDYKDYTGRTAAVDSVEVRAHVWGYLEKVDFKEGSLVKKGDMLFVIDPRAYQAQLDQDLADLTNKKAAVAQKEAIFKRTAALVRTGAATREDYDVQKGDWDVAKAGVGQAEAKVRSSKLNVDWTRIVAPIAGRIGRYSVTVGNLVQSGDQAGGTLLTTIVSVDPMYAYFDVDERTVLIVQKLIRAGKVKSAREEGAQVPVLLGLANEDGYSHRGLVDFVDNQVNPKTGTLRLRGIFPNKEGVLSPGLFVRTRLRIGAPHNALLVVDRAIDTDQGQKIVYVVDSDDKVVVRPVQVGDLHHGLRVIEEGLKPGERVILNGLQQVRPGLTVEPNLVDMPIRPSANVPW